MSDFRSGIAALAPAAQVEAVRRGTDALLVERKELLASLAERDRESAECRAGSGLGRLIDEEIAATLSYFLGQPFDGRFVESTKAKLRAELASREGKP